MHQRINLAKLFTRFLSTPILICTFLFPIYKITSNIYMLEVI